jgi:hypothetical protein
LNRLTSLDAQRGYRHAIELLRKCSLTAQGYRSSGTWPYSKPNLAN